jgi:hypothetical protein
MSGGSPVWHWHVAQASPPASSGTVPVPGTHGSIAQVSDGSVAVSASDDGQTRGGTPLELAAGTAALPTGDA